jgi:hypothetical protein
MTTDDRPPTTERHGPLPRFGAGYIDCECGWNAPRQGVIVWWITHARPAIEVEARAAVLRELREEVEVAIADRRASLPGADRVFARGRDYGVRLLGADFLAAIDRRLGE